MIFYKALKYKILELCLDSLLGKLNENFHFYSERMVTILDLTPGMKIKRIELGELDEDDETAPYWWHDCTIKQIRKGGMGGSGYDVYLDCKETNSESYSGFEVATDFYFKIYV